MATKTLLIQPSVEELAIPSVFRSVTAASNALARLDELVGVLDNFQVFVNAIPVIEAQASSEIENVVTTHDSIFKADTAPGKADANTLSALRLRRAILHGSVVALSRGITAKLAKDLCSEIMGREMTVRTQPGTVIRSAGKTVYTPPEPKQLVELLNQWEKFINREDYLHPLVVMAVSHYQFEAIHPFMDGNGRTGRVLNVLYLIASGEISHPVFQISKYLNENRDEYYKRLRAVDRNQDWVGWVLFILEAVRVSAIDSANKLKQLTELQLRFSEKYEVSSDFAQLIFEKPYLQIGQVVERFGVTRVTAAKWLEELVSQGALRVLVSGRDKFYINQGLVKLLAKQ